MIAPRASGVHVPLFGAEQPERILPGVPALFGLLRFLLGVTSCGEGDDEIGEEGVADAERFICVFGEWTRHTLSMGGADLDESFAVGFPDCLGVWSSNNTARRGQEETRTKDGDCAAKSSVGK